jgi:hypothetical protein
MEKHTLSLSVFGTRLLTPMASYNKRPQNFLLLLPLQCSLEHEMCLLEHEICSLEHEMSPLEYEMCSQNLQSPLQQKFLHSVR